MGVAVRHQGMRAGTSGFGRAGTEIDCERE